MAKKRKQNRIFVTVALLMILIGTAMMLGLTLGERVESSDVLTLVAGFSTIAVGALLLTESAIAVFFYFCFALSIAAIQLSTTEILSKNTALSCTLLVVGFILAKRIPKRR